MVLRLPISSPHPQQSRASVLFLSAIADSQWHLAWVILCLLCGTSALHLTHRLNSLQFSVRKEVSKDERKGGDGGKRGMPHSRALCFHDAPVCVLSVWPCCYPVCFVSSLSLPNSLSLCPSHVHPAPLSWDFRHPHPHTHSDVCTTFLICCRRYGISTSSNSLPLMCLRSPAMPSLRFAAAIVNGFVDGVCQITNLITNTIHFVSHCVFEQN